MEKMKLRHDSGENQATHEQIDCEAPKEKLKDLRNIRRVRFNRCFKQSNQFSGRYRVFMGGAGSGKSYNIALDFMIKIAQKRFTGVNLLVLRKIHASNLDSTFAQLCVAAQQIYGQRWREIFLVSKNPLKIRCQLNGNQIIFRGMKDHAQREKIKSIQSEQGKICWIWCEEATEFSQQDFEILDDRLRGSIQPPMFYQITLSFNPIYADHWLKKRFFDFHDSDALVVTSTYLDNQFIDSNFKKRMQKRAEIDPEGYRIYGLGLWGDTKGLIFTHFEVREFDDRYNRFDSMCFGTDFGFNHAHATLLVGMKDDVIFVCDELILEQKDTNEICTELEKKFVKDHTMWCDCAEPDRIATLKKNGWHARGVKKYPGSVLAQIDWIRARELVIHPRCERLIQELQQWQWQYDPTKGVYFDRPCEGFDDAIAALRYAIEGWRKRSAISFH